MSNKCIFCHIPNIENQKIFLEDPLFYSILDSSPVSKGHTLVIPKKHIVSFFDLTQEEAGILYNFISKVKNKLDEEFNPDAYNIGINDGKAAGRTRDHLHVHLIPRYSDDVKDPTEGIRNLLGKYIHPTQPLKGFN